MERYQERFSESFDGWITTEFFINAVHVMAGANGVRVWCAPKLFFRMLSLPMFQ